MLLWSALTVFALVVAGGLARALCEPSRHQTCERSTTGEVDLALAGFAAFIAFLAGYTAWFKRELWPYLLAAWLGVKLILVALLLVS